MGITCFIGYNAGVISLFSVCVCVRACACVPTYQYVCVPMYHAVMLRNVMGNCLNLIKAMLYKIFRWLKSIKVMLCVWEVK